MEKQKSKLKIELKPEAESFEIGYNKKHEALGKRDDLADFLVLAHRSNRQDYLAKFKNPPSLAELLAERMNDEGNVPVNSAYTPHPMNMPPGVSQAAAGPVGTSPATDAPEAAAEAVPATEAPAATPVTAPLGGTGLATKSTSKDA